MVLKIVEMALKMVQMALKMVENHKYYTKITGIFDSRHIFDVLTSVKNVPNYLSFDYRFSRYNFAKLYQSSKALPKRMALEEAVATWISQP